MGCALLYSVIQKPKLRKALPASTQSFQGHPGHADPEGKLARRVKKAHPHLNRHSPDFKYTPAPWRLEGLE